jgi:hypothetical protein
MPFLIHLRLADREQEPSRLVFDVSEVEPTISARRVAEA